ncbi:LAME_0A07712g1_1 [Lachancea meyersii CBS 8951]|uniref:Ubiquitin thioesterase OTU n=1 Tax=Lachancea meyersii CBS 8951 TaxID=1266667 RepID=A0A1G4IQY0_9SACH|nr:LAME_0A07712g1_1 [Lachancea meyersii CBS 8951]
MRIKVSSLGLATKIVDVDRDCILSDFLRIVSEQLQSNSAFESLRFGFPPQVVEVDDETSKSQRIEDLGISSGEKVVLVRKAEKSGTDSNSTKLGQQHHSEKQTRRKLQENQISLAGIWSDWILQLHSVPDDNSCMFHAISHCIYGDLSHSDSFREEVAAQVIDDPMEYSDAILGRPNRDYAQWILKKSSWGGGIELAILSKAVRLAIFVLDVDAGKFEKFNEQHFEDFIMVAFNGVHYDAMEIVHEKTGQKTRVLSQRSEKINQVLARAREVAVELKSKGFSFNTARDRIKCNICSEILIGEREVARHAEKTGHVDFGQSK